MTLLEIIVVLAVIGLLAAALMPMVLGYLEDAKKSKAEADVRQIATALSNLVKDLRRFPAYVGDTNTGPEDITLLCSGGRLPGPGDWGYTETTCENTGTIDTLDDVLVKNTPLDDVTNKYNETDRRKAQWKGPYGETFSARDPWDNAYVVNIKNGSTDNPDKVIWVLSAGPNGLIDTPSDSPRKTAELVPLVDDIGIRIK